MDLQKSLHQAPLFSNLELLAKQVVEGFISGIHKSPFHGYSAEFAEHKIYNTGESTKHIDWKLFAKTDKLYTKRYEEETNLRCHMILDSSASMYYPAYDNLSLDRLNKIGFGTLAIAALMQLLKKQRDATGLSVYSADFEESIGEKSSERHYRMLYDILNRIPQRQDPAKATRTYSLLHQIAERIHRRSLIFLFSDMLQTEVESKALFDSLKHLKYNKHEVVLFHLTDRKLELEFGFEEGPKRFLDVETGEHIDLYTDQIRENYKGRMQEYLNELKVRCGQYKIKYVEADIHQPFAQVLNTFLVERQKMV